ncbi:unnamed protein product [Vitrella brassicaformis CCMP3155]|uniref:Uncharacterized protein n=1 Tax=Vitrella brassicaformis (strain CCMP3155) TaxID=1169540 RepID=A0A0G4FWW6_VITBC|nr:unnamed protein product [Vitrella brassicaformis CCMP3155]|mmetsp:Transcript_39609/g.99202  ORF Transcript_39609/g.99202 Transcript_39609/m.99202 type:complete len:321 (-) Transcript_39609:48-1010(-)|eukprot:CEM19441.1 unnamed protein product [Vitrella brassicaformis CCMP3155]
MFLLVALLHLAVLAMAACRSLKADLLGYVGAPHVLSGFPQRPTFMFARRHLRRLPVLSLLSAEDASSSSSTVGDDGTRTIRIVEEEYQKEKGEQEARREEREKTVQVEAEQEKVLTDQEWFVRHASEGDESAVQQWLEQGLNPNRCRDEDGRTPLHAAAEGGHLRLTQVMLESGASTDVQSWLGNTPLHSAAVKGHLDIVRLLVDHGADVNMPTATGGWTPLQKACVSGQLEVASFLLEKRADPNSRSDEGWTALDVAALEGFAEIMGLLQTRGAVLSSAGIFKEQKDISNEVRGLLKEEDARKREGRPNEGRPSIIVDE